MKKLLVLILLLWGVHTLLSPPPPTRVEHGVASWYGPRFYGRKTADGTVLERHSRWVAHKTLPLGTQVYITDLSTGRSVKAEVKDRGPYIRGRIVDLTESLAHELGIHHRGIAHVRVDVL